MSESLGSAGGATAIAARYASMSAKNTRGNYVYSSLRSRVMSAYVVAVHRGAKHSFSKSSEPTIKLVAGLGVEGDAHYGQTIQHRSRVASDPNQPNLRQVHLIHAELIDELNAANFRVSVGDLGENITTRGLDLLALPTGTRLMLGASVVLEVTGLRNPCPQLDDFRPGLMAALLGRDAAGNVVRKAGIMAIVVAGGCIDPGDEIRLELPPLPHRALDRV